MLQWSFPATLTCNPTNPLDSRRRIQQCNFKKHDPKSWLCSSTPLSLDKFGSSPIHKADLLLSFCLSELQTCIAHVSKTIAGKWSITLASPLVWQLHFLVKYHSNRLLNHGGQYRINQQLIGLHRKQFVDYAFIVKLTAFITSFRPRYHIHVLFATCFSKTCETFIALYFLLLKPLSFLCFSRSPLWVICVLI